MRYEKCNDPGQKQRNRIIMEIRIGLENVSFFFLNKFNSILKITNLKHKNSNQNRQRSYADFAQKQNKIADGINCGNR